MAADYLTEKIGTERITWFKEIVTAFLGFLIIGGLLYFLAPHLLKDTPDVQSASAIFTMFGGWGGGILGYYLGRLPSERAATKAEAAALSAEKARDVAKLDLRKNILELVEETSSEREKLETYLGKLAKWKEILDQL